MVDRPLYMRIHMGVQYFLELSIVSKYHVQFGDFSHRVLQNVH